MKTISEGDMKTRIARFLFHYRNTPHSTTGVSPAEMLLRRQSRSHLNIMRPNISSNIQFKQLKQKVTHDHHVKNRKFVVDDPVFVRIFATSGSTWLPGTIVEARGGLTFHVEMSDGRIFRRHIDRIRKRTCSVDNESNEGADDFLPELTSPSSETATVSTEATSTTCRRSTRIRNPPDCFM